MFSLLLEPSIFFLFLLYIYELYGIVKRSEKLIPLALDLMYFIYLIIAFTTMTGLNSFYQQYNISQKFLTSGWNLAVALLCAEVLIALLLSKSIVTKFIIKKLPHFFEHVPKERRMKQLPVSR